MSGRMGGEQWAVHLHFKHCMDSKLKGNLPVSWHGF